MAKKNYNSLDLGKFIMAIFVIAIHTRPFSNVTNRTLTYFYGGVFSCAVPFFFLAAGVLLERKLAQQTTVEGRLAVVLKSLKRTVTMYLVWTVVYLPPAVFRFVVEGKPWSEALRLYIRGFLFIGWQYNSWPLWYLLATIYALIALYIFFKLRFSKKMILLLGILAVSLSFCIDLLTKYNGSLPAVLKLVKKLLSYTFESGGIFEGVFYFSTGMLLHEVKVNKWIPMCVFPVSLVLNCFVNNAVLNKLLPMVFSLALFELVYMVDLPDSPVWPILRKMSTAMYFVHMYAWMAFYTIIYHQRTFGFDSFLATTLISVLVGFAYAKHKKRKTANKKRPDRSELQKLRSPDGAS